MMLYLKHYICQQIRIYISNDRRPTSAVHLSENSAASHTFESEGAQATLSPQVNLLTSQKLDCRLWPPVLQCFLNAQNFKILMGKDALLFK